MTGRIERHSRRPTPSTSWSVSRVSSSIPIWSGRSSTALTRRLVSRRSRRAPPDPRAGIGGRRRKAPRRCARDQIVDPLRLIAELLFGLVFVFVGYGYVRRPDHVFRDLVLAFAGLALIFVLDVCLRTARS